MKFSNGIKYFRNLLKYMKDGGVVYTHVSFTQPAQRLAGKRIFISGGSSGIGLGIAKLFLSEGAEVTISGRDQCKLEEVKQTINSSLLHIMKWDVSKLDDIYNKFNELESLTGTFDVFINNAGVYDYASWYTIDSNMYDKVVGTNQKGLFFMCQAEGNYFIKKHVGGKIVNITSIAGIKAGFDPYSISKWGANCITKGLAKELIKSNIVVNGIAPGNVVTNIHAGVKGKKVEENAYMASHLTQRYTLVEEVANLALFLASDSSNNVVGQIIAVDGGWTLK